MVKNNGFTLIELLAVIMILGLVGLIAIPTVTKTLKDSKEKLYNSQVKMIEQSAKKWGIDNIDRLSENKKVYLELNDLLAEGYIEQQELKDPRDSKKTMNGCIIIEYDDNYSKYIYRYNEKTCDEQVQFAITLGGDNYEQFTKVVPTSDGYIVVGASSSTDGPFTNLNRGYGDAIIVKYDKDGNLEWNKNYGGSGEEIFLDIIVVDDGYITVGESYSSDGDLNGLYKGSSYPPEYDMVPSDAIVVKYDFNGNVIWKKSYGGTEDDSLNQIEKIDDGYVVTGYTYSTNSDLKETGSQGSAVIIKYDFNDNIVWKKCFGGSNGESFSTFIETDTGYILSGSSYSTDGDLTGLNKGMSDAIIVKYDLDWNISWIKNFGGSNIDRFNKTILLSDGYLSVGYSKSNNSDLVGLNKGLGDAIIVKHDFDGNIVWNKNYGGSLDFESFTNVILSDNNYIVVGQSRSIDGDLTGLNRGGSDAIMVKYSLNGNVLTKENYGGSGTDFFYDIVKLNNGYIITGSVSSNDTNLDIPLNQGSGDALLLKK